MAALLELSHKLFAVIYENVEQTPLPILLILAITTAVTVLTAACYPRILPIMPNMLT